MSHLKYGLTILLLVCTTPIWAWNAMGHRVVAVIAADQLKPKAQQQAQYLVDYLANAYPYSSSWQMASAWADSLRQDGVQFYNQWHYTDQPYVQNHVLASPVVVPNSTWALIQAQALLANPHSNQYERAFTLRFLLHLTGDAHEPLHDVQLFSATFPQGDRGGNLYLIANPYKNLHSAWDAGLGFFSQNCQLSWSNSLKARCLAQQIEHDYPPAYFGTQINDLNPEHWTHAGYQIAVNFAYQTPLNAPLSADYIKRGQIIIAQQLALAGYRLAHNLNQLYG